MPSHWKYLQSDKLGGTPPLKGQGIIVFSTAIITKRIIYGSKSEFEQYQLQCEYKYSTHSGTKTISLSPQAPSLVDYERYEIDKQIEDKEYRLDLLEEAKINFLRSRPTSHSEREYQRKKLQEKRVYATESKTFSDPAYLKAMDHILIENSFSPEIIGINEEGISWNILEGSGIDQFLSRTGVLKDNGTERLSVCESHNASLCPIHTPVVTISFRVEGNEKDVCLRSDPELNILMELIPPQTQEKVSMSSSCGNYHFSLNNLQDAREVFEENGTSLNNCRQVIGELTEASRHYIDFSFRPDKYSNGVFRRCRIFSD
ncbi:hypothetical protein EOPP23_19740 [Endozoicomonas sp. OPT23]|nr:hypothetical protein [Endozoicomonas sp. OPT23]